MNTRLAPLALVLFTACGGGGSNPDAGSDIDGSIGQQCAEFAAPAGTITSYPGSFAGDLAGAGADIDAPSGACADERDYYEPVGEDQVVELTGLTAGALYGVIVDSAADTSFYVATDCDGSLNQTVAGQCLLFVDSSLGGEQAEFTAPASGTAFVVIDNYSDAAIGDGSYLLQVVEAECVDDTACTSPDASHCYRYACVECVSGFDCDSTAPACDASNTCVASLDECTGDDSAEPDDGPTAATVLTPPTAGVPTVVNAAICNQPNGEGDWFELTLDADTEVGFGVTWSAASGADIDLLIWDDLGGLVDFGFNNGTEPEAFRSALLAGTYYLQIDQYRPVGVTAATAYTLTVRLPECDTSFDCVAPTAPACDASGACGDGPAACTGDDPGDDSHGDDGPAGSRSLTGAIASPVQLTGAVCDTPATEADFYQVTVGAGEGLVASLAWATSDDLDLVVFDHLGRVVGVSYYVEPEVVTLSYLPAGSYYLQVTRYASAPVVAAVAYTITATRTAVQTCGSSADCDDVYSTQLYRGDCNAGVCQFIDGGGAVADGQPCDSGDDCSSTRCSYIVFEADAASSVCTTTCTSTANCAALSGTTCTTGFSTNICVPACSSNLDCGANVGSATLDSGQPWDYLTCTTSGGTCGI